MIAPIVKPTNTKECDVKQSKYEVAPRLPFSQIMTGPCSSVKGTLLSSMMLDIYRDVFERIYIGLFHKSKRRQPMRWEEQLLKKIWKHPH